MSDKFAGLFIKCDGEYSLYGSLDANVQGKIDTLKEMTLAGGKIGTGRGQKQAQAACVIHSTRGQIKSRNFKV